MKRRDVFIAVLPVFDAAAVFVGYSAAYAIRARTDLIPFIQTPESLPPYVIAAEIFGLFALSAVLVFALNGLYRLRIEGPIASLPRLAWSTMLWWFGVVGTYAIVVHELFFSRLVLIYGVGVSFLLLLGIRLVLHFLRRSAIRHGFAAQRVVLVGQNTLATRILGTLEREGSLVVGVMSSTPSTAWIEAHPGMPYLGTLADLPAIVDTLDELIVCEEELSRQELEQAIDICHQHYCRFRIVPSVFEIHNTNVVADDLDGTLVLELKPTRLDGWGVIVKRLVDLIASTLLLVVLSPVYLVVGLLVVLTSRGPAFVGLTRVRKDHTFKMYKFRSMVVNAHAMKKELLRHNERQGPLFKMKNDPRITPLGRFLRKSRIDELPQLWNVLRGDMSLVGPRAHEPEEVAQYAKGQKKLLAILPGMTGMAQVHGASDLTFDEEVRLDTYYIEHWSLLLDLQILIRTVLVVLLGRGAA